MKNNFVVIMAGGFGERFWPKSSQKKPKQFLDLNNCGSTLIKQTYDRFKKICKKNNIYVATHEKYKKLVLENINEINEENIILEPEKKNTSPCILLSTFIINKINKNSNVLFSPADHHIGNEDDFNRDIKKCFNFIENNKGILTIGIKPTYAATGYGYIKTNKKIKDGFYEIDEFVEKPKIKKATIFFKDKKYYWNAGIFVSKTETIINEFKKNGQHNHKVLCKIKDFDLKTIKKEYKKMKSISFDYEILEKCKLIHMLKCDFNWSDLGSWSSVSKFMKEDYNKNKTNSKRIKTFNSKDNIINIDQKNELIVEGINNYIIIQHKNKILICKKKNEQKIKDFLKD